MGHFRDQCIDPFKSTEILWKLAGAALLAQAFFDIVGLFLCPRVIVVEKAEVKEKAKEKEETEEEK